MNPFSLSCKKAQMTFTVTAPYTVSIPEPVLPGDLEQLAQISVPGNKLLVVYWMRSTRQAVSSYDGKWYIQSDQNMLSAIGRIIKYEHPIDLLTMDGLFVFETPGHGFAADDDMIRNFRDCEWSDYASDRMAFQCNIREKNLVEKNTIEDQTNVRNIENIIRSAPAAPVAPTTPAPVVPVLTRATECCCTGCHKNVQKNYFDKDKNNGKW